MNFDDIWTSSRQIEGWFGDADAAHYYNILRSLGNDSIVVEVGVYKGRSTSIPILMGLNVTAVDTFGTDTGDTAYFDEFVSHVYDMGQRVTIICGTSVDAAPRFADCSVDLVLIDANHYKEGVELDVQLWLPKLKHGGWFMFHDYNSVNFPDVVSVVDQYCGTWEGTCIDTLFAKRKP